MQQRTQRLTLNPYTSVKYVLILGFLIWGTSAFTQDNNLEHRWVDSVFNSFTFEEKIGQLFMIRAFSKPDTLEINKVKSYIKDYKVGGICFFQGSPTKQVALTKEYQTLSKTPLMIGIDGEWGVAMRFPESAIGFPKQLTLGAISDNDLIVEMGKEIALQCKRMGIHVNFAPVVDVNNNPVNPVINYRSFGEDVGNVTDKALLYMQSLQENGIMACAKHFPGHGDTDVDSHVDLPVIHHGIERLSNTELMPFKALMNAGIGSVMVAHLHVPIFDNRENRSATLSKAIVTDLLRGQLGFGGLIFTDAMEMKGVSKHFPKGVADAEAFLAGNDMILLPEDLPSGIQSIISYLQQGLISEDRINESVKRILRAKYRFRVFDNTQPDPIGVASFVNRPEALALKNKLLESSLTLVSDEFNQIPIRIKKEQNWMAISIGSSPGNAFLSRLQSYAPFYALNITKDIPTDDREAILTQACDYDYVVVSLHDMTRLGSKNFGITNESLAFIEELNKVSNVILCVFGSPYALRNFEKIPTLVAAYEDDEITQDLAAQALFGAIEFKGRLPVSASPKFYYQHGLMRKANGILGFSIAERVGMDSKVLDGIDALADELISAKAAPGCQILVAKDNKIIYQKSFGSHTYDQARHVRNTDVYDLASLTKILAGTLGVMKLYDQKKIILDAPIGLYLDGLANTDKEKLKINEILAHQSGLQAWIPFYEATITKSNNDIILAPELYRNSREGLFHIPVAQKLFLHENYLDTIRQKIRLSPLLKNKDYKYSDLGFYFVKDLVENISGKNLQDFLDQHYYQALGLRKTMFNPIQRVTLEEIVPSEQDQYWRKQMVHGTVHDMGAAMLGGVAGHAGLFSNTQEIASIMQMLLNKGRYGGYRFLSEETIATFTQRYGSGTRRALGFDMKELDANKTPNLAAEAPASVFGHTGFTGTCTYADPENNLIYVFLSNRTFPTMENNTLLKNNYRTRIQEIIYRALKKQG